MVTSEPIITKVLRPQVGQNNSHVHNQNDYVYGIGLGAAAEVAELAGQRAHAPARDVARSSLQRQAAHVVQAGAEGLRHHAAGVFLLVEQVRRYGGVLSADACRYEQQHQR